jgi:hypothetical protein
MVYSLCMAVNYLGQESLVFWVLLMLVLLTYLDSYFVIKKLKEDYFLFNLHILLMFHLKIILGLEKKNIN